MRWNQVRKRAAPRTRAGWIVVSSVTATSLGALAGGLALLRRPKKEARAWGGWIWLSSGIGAGLGGILGGLLFWRRWRRARRGETGGRRVREAMTPTPRVVEPSVPVIEAARLMRAEDVGALPVVEGERLVGVVTDRDIAMRVVAEGKDPQALPVGDVASGDPVTVRPEQDLDEALRLMARRQVRRLMVIENGQRLVGVLAQADVARKTEGEKAGEVVEKISKPTESPRR